MVAGSQQEREMKTHPPQLFASAAALFICGLSYLPAADKTKPGSPVLKIGTQKQLLVDNYIIAKTENLKFEAGQATNCLLYTSDAADE